MMYMAEVMQIVGAIALIAIGVGVIVYTLMRRSPTVEREQELRAIEESEDELAADGAEQGDETETAAAEQTVSAEDAE